MSELMKAFYTLEEAAEKLTSLLKENVSVDHLLDWAALESGHLTISFYVRAAKVHDLEDDELISNDAGRRHSGDRQEACFSGYVEPVLSRGDIEELRAEQEVELSDWMTVGGRPALVWFEHGDDARGPLASSIDSFYVAGDELQRLENGIRGTATARVASLSTKERRTYLRLIAGLCKATGIDWTARGQSQRISRFTDDTGESVGVGSRMIT